MDHTFRTYIIFYTLRDWDKVKKKKRKKERVEGERETASRFWKKPK